MLLIFRKNHKATFLLSYFSMTKSTKSHIRERSPLFENSSRVHELVAGSSAWQVRATKDKAKVGGFIAPHSFMLPRVRTYHTRKPSRFVHALSARPHNRRGSSTCADRIEYIFFAFFYWLCFGLYLVGVGASTTREET